MKTFTRFSLAAVAIAAVLGSTSCAAQTPASNDKGAASPVVEPIKIDGFMEKLDFTGAPEEWNGSAGWTTTTGPEDENVAVIGDYVAYVADREYQPGSDWEIKTHGSLVVVDGKGNVVYESDPVPAESKLAFSEVETISHDGVQYLVYAETLMSDASDPTSVKQTGEVTKGSTVTVLDKDLKVVVKKKLDDGASAYLVDGSDGAVNIRKSAGTSTTVSEVMNIPTGEITPTPAMDGHRWVGRYDGVDIFRDQLTGETTNGEWNFTESKGTYDATGGVNTFGKYIKLPMGDSYSGCKVVDPHTGEELLISGKVADCVFGQDQIASPNGQFISVLGGVLNVADGSVYPITEDMKFSVHAISDNGDIYGTSNGATAHANALKSDEPKRQPGTSIAPSQVSASGLAVFAGEKNSPAGEMITSFIVKK